MEYLACDGKAFGSIIECENYEKKLDEEILAHYDFYDVNIVKLNKTDPNNEIAYIAIRKDDIKIKNFIIDLIQTNIDNDCLQALKNNLPWDYEGLNFKKTIYGFNFDNEEWEDTLLEIKKIMEILEY